MVRNEGNIEGRHQTIRLVQVLEQSSLLSSINSLMNNLEIIHIEIIFIQENVDNVVFIIRGRVGQHCSFNTKQQITKK